MNNHKMMSYRGFRLIPVVKGNTIRYDYWEPFTGTRYAGADCHTHNGAAFATLAAIDKMIAKEMADFDAEYAAHQNF